MRIKSTRHRLTPTHSWRIARTENADDPQIVVVELISADGIIGRGEAAPISRYRETCDSVENFFPKIDVTNLSTDDLNGSHAYLNSLSDRNWAAKCAIDIALFDAAGKRANKAIYDLLGLGFTENVHSTSFTIGIDSAEVLKTKVAAAESFEVLKVKMGVAGDKENLQAIREISPRKKIRADANEGWRTKEEALEMIEWLANDGNVEFVEQPLRVTAPVEDWIWLKQRSPLPIFADESYHNADDIDLAANCFHGVNVKLVKAGGISGALRALRAARKAGLKTMLGCMLETSILISAAAHLADLCDYFDLDGNLLITNDPYVGVTAEKGVLSFAACSEKSGLRVSPRQ